MPDTPAPLTLVGFLAELLARSSDGRLPCPCYHRPDGRRSPAGLLIPESVFAADRHAMFSAATVYRAKQPAALHLDDVLAIERFNDEAWSGQKTTKGWSHAGFCEFLSRLKSFRADERCRAMLKEAYAAVSE